MYMKPKVVVTIVVGVLIAFVFLIAYQSIVPNEIAKMQRELPMKIDDGMTLTEVYESGRTIYYLKLADF